MPLVGKKIPKRKLNKLKASEKEEENVFSSSGGHKAKSLQQNVPKSLLKFMEICEKPKPSRHKMKRAGMKILTADDKKFKSNTRATQCHLRHLKNSAMEKGQEIKKTEDRSKRVMKERQKSLNPDHAKRTQKVKNLFATNKQLKNELKKQKRKLNLKIARYGKAVALKGDESDSEMEDTTGFDEVQFGETVDRPPRLHADKFMKRLQRRKMEREGGAGDGVADL